MVRGGALTFLAPHPFGAGAIARTPFGAGVIMRTDGRVPRRLGMGAACDRRGTRSEDKQAYAAP